MAAAGRGIDMDLPETVKRIADHHMIEVEKYPTDMKYIRVQLELAIIDAITTVTKANLEELTSEMDEAHGT